MILLTCMKSRLHLFSWDEKTYSTMFLRLQRRLKKNRAGIPGNTTVIQGAPGAGKSSILSHIQNILRKGGNDIPNAGILILNSEDIHSPADILRPLAYQVSQEQAATFLTKEQKTQSFSTKGKRLVAEVEGNIETTVEQSPDEATLAAFKQWITRQDLTESFAHRPIIIAIDEAQAFECTKGHAISSVC